MKLMCTAQSVCLVLLFGVIATSPHYAIADGADSQSSETKVAVSLGSRYSPVYLGADEYTVKVMPGFAVNWQNGWTADIRKGIGYNFSHNRAFDYGIRLAADFGRKESASSALSGLGDIKMSAELGSFFSYSPSKHITLHSTVRYGSGIERDGVLLDLGVNYRIPLADRHIISLGVTSVYANQPYMQSYFGVNATQSAASGYAIYTPNAGIRDVNLSANYMYKLDKNWHINTGVTLGQLGISVKSAPMTQSSSHNSAHTSVSYNF